MFDCSGLTCEELAEMLKEARDAYRQLMTGKSARVIVDQNGERVEFTAVNVSRLNGYIQLILSQMRASGCACATEAPQVKAFKFIF